MRGENKHYAAYSPYFYRINAKIVNVSNRLGISYIRIKFAYQHFYYEIYIRNKNEYDKKANYQSEKVS